MTAVGSRESEFYAEPKSSYYYAPPDASRAFGQPVTGTPGVHRPKDIVRIERDYSDGELPQFHTSFPLELQGRLIDDINAVLRDAHNVGKLWRDNTLAILSFYITSTLFSTHYRRTMDKLTSLIDKANTETLNPCGLHIVHPRKTAFLFCEVEYY